MWRKEKEKFGIWSGKFFRHSAKTHRNGTIHCQIQWMAMFKLSLKDVSVCSEIMFVNVDISILASKHW